MTEEPKQEPIEPEKPKKPEKERDWTCLLCGKSYNHKYRYMHTKICMPKKKTSKGPSKKEIKEVAEAVEKLEKIVEPDKPVEVKPKVLSEIIQDHHEEGEEPGELELDDEVADIVEDPKLNFYLQIAIVVGIVIAALFVGYKAITNQPQVQQEVMVPPVDLGFTDERGVYYGPGEYHH